MSRRGSPGQRCSGQIQVEAYYFIRSTSSFPDRDVQGKFKKRLPISNGQQAAFQTEMFRAISRRGLLFHMVNKRLPRQRFSGQSQEKAYFFIWSTIGFPDSDFQGKFKKTLTISSG
jgi:hypothetical protein